jgi:peptidoglycan/xylan/chitin deacetylase (PgdA/CDA1 family)
MIPLIQSLVRSTDGLIARAYLSLFRERSGLLSFLFHSLFADERDAAQNDIDPLQSNTLAEFRGLVEYYLEHDYRFVGPDELLAGLEPGGKYAMLTFDDGYFNNTLALPVLEEYRVPALFFISTDHVQKQKCFWWDVLYRERLTQGVSGHRLHDEIVAMKSQTTEQIEAELAARFGAGAFAPRSEIDRPFTPDELREFAAHPHVHLGNHTANHAILTNYTPDQVRVQIAAAQAALEGMTGQRPRLIAYPNGAHSHRVVQTCAELGLQAGFTVQPKKNPVPLGGSTSELLRLGRFAPHGGHAIVDQCRTYRSDLLLYGALRSGYLKLNPARALNSL